MREAIDMSVPKASRKRFADLRMGSGHPLGFRHFRLRQPSRCIEQEQRKVRGHDFKHDDHHAVPDEPADPELDGAMFSMNRRIASAVVGWLIALALTGFMWTFALSCSRLSQ